MLFWSLLVPTMSAAADISPDSVMELQPVQIDIDFVINRSDLIDPSRVQCAFPSHFQLHKELPHYKLNEVVIASGFSSPSLPLTASWASTGDMAPTMMSLRRRIN